mmetsp:Transcript_14757/g.35838  ORF Transcript_14757/g.35838 Transcript_14757/m.35838 type:complete len:581 (-) Transcript_14757:314-2056(-)
MLARKGTMPAACLLFLLSLTIVTQCTFCQAQAKAAAQKPYPVLGIGSKTGHGEQGNPNQPPFSAGGNGFHQRGHNRPDDRDDDRDEERGPNENQGPPGDGPPGDEWDDDEWDDDEWDNDWDENDFGPPEDRPEWGSGSGSGSGSFGGPLDPWEDHGNENQGNPPDGSGFAYGSGSGGDLPPPVLGTPVPTQDNSVEQTPFFVDFEMIVRVVDGVDGEKLRAALLEEEEWRTVLLEAFELPRQSVQINFVDFVSRRQALRTRVEGTLFARDRVSAGALSRRLRDEGKRLVKRNLASRGVEAQVEFPEAVETVTQAEGGVTPAAPASGVTDVVQTDYFVDVAVSASGAGVRAVGADDWRSVLAAAMSLPRSSVQINSVAGRRQAGGSAEVEGTLFARDNEGALSLGGRMRNQGPSLIRRALETEAGLSDTEVSVLSAEAKTTMVLTPGEGGGSASGGGLGFNPAYLGLLGLLVVPLLAYARWRGVKEGRRKQQQAQKVDAYLSSQVVIPVGPHVNLDAQLSQQRPPASNPGLLRPSALDAQPSAPDFPPSMLERGGGLGLAPTVPRPPQLPPGGRGAGPAWA